MLFGLKLDYLSIKVKYKIEITLNDYGDNKINTSKIEHDSDVIMTSLSWYFF